MGPKAQQQQQQQQQQPESDGSWQHAVAAFAETPDAIWILGSPGGRDTEVQIMSFEDGTMRIKPTAAGAEPFTVTVYTSRRCRVLKPWKRQAPAVNRLPKALHNPLPYHPLHTSFVSVIVHAPSLVLVRRAFTSTSTRVCAMCERRAESFLLVRLVPSTLVNFVYFNCFSRICSLFQTGATNDLSLQEI
jgi:hypothetical protein